jgi:hypothetical protein
MSDEKVFKPNLPYWNEEFMSELIKYGIDGMINAGKFHPGHGLLFVFDKKNEEDGKFIANLVIEYFKKLDVKNG